MTQTLGLILVTALALGACSPAEPPPAAAPAAQSVSNNPSSSVIKIASS